MQCCWRNSAISDGFLFPPHTVSPHETPLDYRPAPHPPGHIGLKIGIYFYMNIEWQIRYGLAIACSIGLIICVLLFKRCRMTNETKVSLIIVAVLAMTSQIVSALTHIDTISLSKKTVSIFRYVSNIQVGMCCGILLNLWVFERFKPNKPPPEIKSTPTMSHG